MLTKRRPFTTAVLAVALITTAMSAGCTASNTPTPSPITDSHVPSFTWKSTSLQRASTALTDAQALGVAADDTSFALAALGPSGPSLPMGECSCTKPEVYTSSDDGATWRSATLSGLTALAQQPIAGYAGRLYVLGDTSTNSGPALAVWTSTDARHWSKAAPLPEPAVLEPSAYRGEVAGAGIAAGSGGLEVFVEDGTFLDFLHGKESVHFSQPASEVLQYGGTTPVLSTDGSGYVFIANGEDKSHAVSEAEVYTSPDGTTWTNETSALPVNTANWGTYAGAGNSGTLAVAGWTTSFANGISPVTEIWTQTSQPDGVWNGTYNLNPGRLPQPGVGPIGSQIVNDIVPLGSGFLATGSGTSDANTPTPIYFAAVWYSPNGETWIKQPETTTGFEHAADMWGVAVHGTHIVLVGYTTNPFEEELSGLRIWHGAFTP